MTQSDTAVNGELGAIMNCIRYMRIWILQSL
jgi:hypothetical protein